MLSSGAIKRGIKLTLIFLFLPILMALSVNDFNVKTGSTYVTDAPSGYGEPTPMAKKVGIFVTSNGIIKQVNNNYNVTLGDPINISADGARTFGRPLKYQWFEASKKDKWHPMDSKKYTSNHLSLPSTEKGTYWFQLRMSYSILGTQHYMYTNVAKVTVTSNRIKADSISLATNSDYIYNKSNFFNNNSTYALASIKPENSTEQVKWSLNSEDEDLAHIDNDGKITANIISDKEAKSGEIEVHATANHNFPHAELTHATKKIKVGGGLLDTHASVGKKALFEIQGMNNATSRMAIDNVDIIWKCKKKGTDEYQDVSDLNKSDNIFAFKTSDVSASDNGDLYQATVKTSINNEKQSYTTNPARLIVNSNEDSGIDLSVTIENNFYTSSQNTATNLKFIRPGDQISYNVVINNNSKNIINSSILTIFVPKDTQTDPNYVIIPMETNEIKYLSPTIEGDIQRLKFEILSLKPQETRTIRISLHAPNINKKQTLTFKPTLSYINMEQKNEVKGQELNFTFVTNRIELHPQNIIFEPITLFDKDIIKHRTSSDTPITIDDQVVNRPEEIDLYLQQTTDFMDKANHTLPFHLLFYKPDGSITDLKNNTLIATSEPYAPLEPIHWDRNHGALLHVDNAANLIPGNYSADVTWTVEQVLPNDAVKTSTS